MIETKRRVGRPPNLKIAGPMKRHNCSRATAYRMAEQKPRLRMQSRHSNAETGLDAYFTCPQAVIALMALERAWLPRVILDPCAGKGAFTTLMAEHGYETYANDIFDYGLEGCTIRRLPDDATAAGGRGHRHQSAVQAGGGVSRQGAQRNRLCRVPAIDVAGRRRSPRRSNATRQIGFGI